MRKLRIAISRERLFKEELVDSLIERIKAQFTGIDDLRCFGYLTAGDSLSTREKKALGLNARRKYSASFVQMIDLTHLEGRCPNTVYENIYQDACNRTRRKSELLRMKQVGITEVEILDPFGGTGCSAISHKKKFYHIEEVPELPLPSCDMDFCRCCYIARIVGFS